jgi:hypothetical protein
MRTNKMLFFFSFNERVNSIDHLFLQYEAKTHLELHLHISDKIKNLFFYLLQHDTCMTCVE